MISGVGVALTTLFTESLDVDVDATVEHAVRLAGLGMEHVLVAGSTGEAAALTEGERSRLIMAVRGALPETVGVLAGTGAPSSYQAMRLTSQAVDAGADAVLVLSPRGSHELRTYFTAVAHVADGTPVLGYHFPAMSAPGIPVGILQELPIAGCKDSTGDPTRLLQELTETEVPIFVGSTGLLAMAGPMGAAGAILQAANAEPELCVRAFSGDTDAQLALAEAHLATKDRAPNGTKELMAAKWGTPTHSRIR
ncbi:MAG: dihydrodipicolinate synthase family protein [Acidimicrobiia bacterium]|nr:dihydrodipicolinate synthase family protein [Acidimicrobiia bacterium]